MEGWRVRGREVGGVRGRGGRWGARGRVGE